MEKIIRKISLHDKRNHDLEYWLSKTPEERVAAIEFLRQQYFVENNIPQERIKKVARIVHSSVKRK